MVTVSHRSVGRYVVTRLVKNCLILGRIQQLKFAQCHNILLAGVGSNFFQILNKTTIWPIVVLEGSNPIRSSQTAEGNFLLRRIFLKFY